MFLSRARALSFTIDDFRNLPILYADTERASAEVKQVAEGHHYRIVPKIVELMELRAALPHLIGACVGDHRPDCPLLANLTMKKILLPSPMRPTDNSSRSRAPEIAAFAAQLLVAFSPRSPHLPW